MELNMTQEQTKKSLSGNPNLVQNCFYEQPQNPLHLLTNWIKTAEKIGVREPRSFTLSTVDPDGKPWCRILLLKDEDDKGICFSTGATSRKGRELTQNNYCAGNLWWRETMQQISFSGPARPLSNDISDKLFYHRTREAQAVAAISEQSSALPDKQALNKKVEALVVSNQIILRPKNWHAYFMKIEEIDAIKRL